MNNARRDTEWLQANRPQPTKYHCEVRNPAHYTEGREYEPIDVIEDWKLPFHLGNALKYIARAGRKDPAKTRQDISKAIWYLERFSDQFVESEAQAKDANDLIDQAEREFLALGERFDNIPQSVIPGPDDDDVPFTYTYDEQYRKAAGLDGIGGATHEDIILFEEWTAEDDVWKDLADH